MTPANKIKREILMKAIKNEDVTDVLLDKDDNVEKAYEKLKDLNIHWDYESEFREGHYKTDIDAPYSRNYESQSVARKMSDGSWIGWTYWYGGGKHSEPEAIDWMTDAYELDYKEEEKVVVVRTFTVKK